MAAQKMGPTTAMHKQWQAHFVQRWTSWRPTHGHSNSPHTPAQTTVGRGTLRIPNAKAMEGLRTCAIRVVADLILFDMALAPLTTKNSTTTNGME